MNDLVKSIVLGLVQGLTEFLPISSSGHLVIASKVLGFSSPGVLFEVVLHMGTLFAVIFYYRDYLLKIKFEEIKYFIYATIPAGIVGVLFRGPAEALFDSTVFLSLGFLISAAINYYMDRSDGKKEKPDGFDAWMIGFAQAFAIIPSVSRSGATILAAKKLKINAEAATRFSLLISIPAIIGANLVEVYSHGLSNGVDFTSYMAGFTAAFISGFLTIGPLVNLLKGRRMKIFSIYLIILAIISLFI